MLRNFSAPLGGVENEHLMSNFLTKIPTINTFHDLFFKKLLCLSSEEIFLRNLSLFFT